MPYLSALESDWSVHGLTVIVCVSTVVASLHVSRTEVYSLRSHPFHVCCVVQQCSPSARICIIIGWSTEGDAEHLSYAYRHTAAHKQVREREGERAKRKKVEKVKLTWDWNLMRGPRVSADFSERRKKPFVSLRGMCLPICLCYTVATPSQSFFAHSVTHSLLALLGCVRAVRVYI